VTHYPIAPCAECGISTLVIDEEASNLISEDGSTLMTLRFPRKATVQAAMRIAAREGQASGDAVVRELLDGLMLAMEILSRLVVYGVDGTGDDDADDIDFERALAAAHDVACAFGRSAEHVEFCDVQIDVSNALCTIEDEEACVTHFPLSPIEA